MARIKERTSPIVKKASAICSLFSKEYTEHKNNAGWGFETQAFNSNDTIKVSAFSKAEAKDGVVFDFVMSSLFARNHHLHNEKQGYCTTLSSKQSDYGYDWLEIDLSEVLKFQKKGDRTENRVKILESLHRMKGFKIETTIDGLKHSYGLLDDVQELTYNIVKVRVNRTINEAYEEFGLKWINIERMLPLKSKYAIELARFLQLKGGAVRLNEVQPPDRFSHDEIIHFLHLVHLEERYQIKELKKAITQIGKQGFATYQMKRDLQGKIIWWISTDKPTHIIASICGVVNHKISY